MNPQRAEQLPDDNGVKPIQKDDKSTALNVDEVEKGSGYGPPNEGSGETVSRKDLSPDGQPIQQQGDAASKA
jgi:hypothetical protein